MKIFWSWQSDTPGKTGRHFVRDVLDAAIDELKQSLEVEEPTEREARADIHLDHDRKGIAGSPDLARVILEKIEQSVVFVADVTPVGVVREKPDDPSSPVVKKPINPNVGIELGYALHALTDRALLMVMNEHYGGRADLPFDLQSKAGPITYNLRPDADRNAIVAGARSLKAKLVEALKLCLANRAEGRRQAQPFAEARATRNPALYFEPNEVLARVGSPAEHEYRLEAEHVAYIRLFPTYADQPSIGLAKLMPVFHAQKPCPMSLTIGGVPGRNRYGPIIYDPIAASGIAGLTQGFERGELWGVNGAMIVMRQRQRRRPSEPAEAIAVVPMINFEKIYVRVLDNYVKVAAAELKLRLPYTVELGAFGLNGAFLGVPGGLDGQGQLVGPVMTDVVQRRYQLTKNDDASVNALLRSYFSDVYDLTACARSELLTDDIIAAHGLPPR